MSHSPHSDGDLLARIYICSGAEAVFIDSSVLPSLSRLSAGPRSQWQLGKHRLMN